MYILGILQTSVFTRGNKYEILVHGVHLLQFLDFLQHDIVHAVFVGAKYTLCFYTYSHSCLMIFAGTPATSEWGGTSLVTTAPAAITE